MHTMNDIIFDVTLPENKETVTFVNISVEKIQQAMKEAFDISGAKEEGDAEVFLKELANRLNTKGNTISWRGKVMKMNFSVE